jgi:hypothetical protein
MGKYWEFDVEGVGAFPRDMLRYDACYPARPQDADKLFVDVRSREAFMNMRTVRLISQVKAPTDDRWASFGWVVTRVEKRTR